MLRRLIKEKKQHRVKGLIRYSNNFRIFLVGLLNGSGRCICYKINTIKYLIDENDVQWKQNTICKFCKEFKSIYTDTNKKH